jgi:hypothetical protein
MGGSFEDCLLDVSKIRSDAAKKARDDEAAAGDTRPWTMFIGAATEKMPVRALAIKQMYEADCKATRDWIAAQNATEQQQQHRPRWRTSKIVELADYQRPEAIRRLVEMGAER